MNSMKPKVFAVKHKNDEVRASSRSGGIFTALTDEIIKQNGVVYGCILTEDFQAVHVRAETSEERDSMRGSKYIQSHLGNTYKNVLEDLKAGRRVLFSGTSCQIAGLKKYLRDSYANLVCIDIVCHGVPSPKVWNSYLKWQERKHHSKIQKVEFRNKKDFGWRDHVESLTMDDGSVINSKVFTTLFYGHSILRPSCYECPYKSVMHPGDITIADYWGIENAAPEFDDNRGVSLVLVNNEKGENLFETIKGNINWKSTLLEKSMQPPLIAPFPAPQEREQFWSDFQNSDFNKVAKKYAGVGVKHKIKEILRKVKHKIFK